MVRVSLGLPTHRVDLGDEMISATAVAELARGAEAGGFDSVYVTDHPFPGIDTASTGGHHTLDPFVTLAFAAAATSTLRLLTNLIVLAYRNPFLTAKSVSSLDVLSGGRVTMGVGAGYLEPEFAALGVDFTERNDLVDESIRAMKAAWTGQPITYEGRHFSAPGNVMLPRPAQTPGPPIWVGGNSKRAVRRAIELADGWMPMPTPVQFAPRLKTAAITGIASVASRLNMARDMAAEAGRTEPLTFAFTPPSLLMTGHQGGLPSAAELIDEAGELAAAGVGVLTVSLPGDTRADLLRSIDGYSTDVLPSLAALSVR